MKPIRKFSWGDHERPSTAAIGIIAEVLQTNPTALDPMYSIIDPDSVDTLLTRETFSGSIQFEYAGLVVVLRSDGIGYLYQQAPGTETDINTVAKSMRNRERCLRQ